MMSKARSTLTHPSQETLPGADRAVAARVFDTRADEMFRRYETLVRFAYPDSKHGVLRCDISTEPLVAVTITVALHWTLTAM
jgi:hypothetical protein